MQPAEPMVSRQRLCCFQSKKKPRPDTRYKGAAEVFSEKGTSHDTTTRTRRFCGASLNYPLAHMAERDHELRSDRYSNSSA
jgi:hypothetical protein